MNLYLNNFLVVKSSTIGLSSSAVGSVFHTRSTNCPGFEGRKRGITMLMQDDLGGLQVMGLDNEWIHTPPMDDSYIVNLGDMIARWTNDKYRSTLHRVVNFSGKDRYSIPFFYNGRLDHKVAALPGCLEPGETPRYPPTTFEAHMRDMYARTYIRARPPPKAKHAQRHAPRSQP
jgi:hypothetical protein